MEPHILFAEDDPDTRELVQVFLQGAGFRVSLAGTSADALNRAATEQFDALLLDDWMPEITGLELCRKIRIFNQKTPILFCSGAVTDVDKEAATLAGAQGYVEKPFDPDDLTQILRSVLEQAHLSRSSSN